MPPHMARCPSPPTPSSTLPKLTLHPTPLPLAHAHRPSPPSDYHPDKHERMKAVMKYYLKGEKLALNAFPGGSEPGS